MSSSAQRSSDRRSGTGTRSSAAGGQRPIIADRLGKDYGAFTALQDVSVDLSAGELVCVLGQNGEGKSTLLKLLALTELPTRGRIIVQGRDTSCLNERQKAQIREEFIHYVPQTNLGLVSGSALENITYWLRFLDGLSPDEADLRARQELAVVGLKEQEITQDIARFNGGKRALVAVALLLARRKPICLADEVLAALSTENAVKMIGLLQEMARQWNAAVAIIVHGQPELLDYFDRVITIRRHRLAPEDDQRNPHPRRAPIPFRPSPTSPMAVRARRPRPRAGVVGTLVLVLIVSLLVARLNSWGSTAPDTTAEPSLAQNPIDTPAPPERDLMGLLPTEAEAPEGLVVSEERFRSLEEVAQAYSDPAATLAEFSAWGWQGNAYRVFIPGNGAPASVDGVDYARVGIHRFGNSDHAAEAAAYIARDNLLGTGGQEQEGPPIGDGTVKLLGQNESGNWTILIVRKNVDVLSVGASSPRADPYPVALELAETVLQKEP